MFFKKKGSKTMSKKSKSEKIIDIDPKDVKIEGEEKVVQEVKEPIWKKEKKTIISALIGAAISTGIGIATCILIGSGAEPLEADNLMDGVGEQVADKVEEVVAEGF
jgi:hypothetical protein